MRPKANVEVVDFQMNLGNRIRLGGKASRIITAADEVLIEL